MYKSIEAVQHQNDPLLFDYVPVAVYTCDRGGIITSYNKVAADLWGYEPVIGKDLWCGFWKLFYPDGVPMPLDKCPMAETLQNGVAIEGVEIIIQRPDGTKKSILPYPVPTFDGSGKLIGSANTLIDITELKKSEEKQARLAAIVDSSDDAIVSKTLEGIITSWNRAAEVMWGYSEKEAIGRHISMLIPKDRLDEEILIIDKIKKGEKIDHYETIRLTKAGKEIPISLTVSPVRNQSGYIIGASKIARNIQRQKEIEEELRSYTVSLTSLYEEVKQLNARKDEFIGIASHELKTPLTSMKGYLQLLERNLVDEMDLNFARKALRQVDNLSGLVADLLDVARIQSGKLQLSLRRFDFSTLLMETIDVMQQSTKTHRLILQGHEGSAMIEADWHRIEQVLINLLNNAIKYSPSADRVEIRLDRSDSGIALMIKDYGIGIAPESQAAIFSRFYREEGLEPDVPGLGLGLFISKEIIDRHQGKIWLESELGKGTSFFFSIPNVQ